MWQISCVQTCLHIASRSEAMSRVVTAAGVHCSTNMLGTCGVWLLLLLCRLETTRRVSVITITLSREPLDSSNVGYQPPLPEDQVRSQSWLQGALFNNMCGCQGWDGGCVSSTITAKAPGARCNDAIFVGRGCKLRTACVFAEGAYTT
jgi:hypothetical protein